MKKLRKSVNICQSYRKNKSGTFFYGPRCSSSCSSNRLPALKHTFNSDQSGSFALGHPRFVDVAREHAVVIVSVVKLDGLYCQRVIVGRHRDSWVGEVQRRGLTFPFRRRHRPAPRLTGQLQLVSLH